MATYDCGALEQLWIQAGGPSAVAGLMASIAMAESSGNSAAVNPSSGATGLWQILPLPGRPGGMTDPLANAKEAVSLYNTQGLGAWDASRPVWSVKQPCGGGGATGAAPGGSQAPTGGATTLPAGQCIYFFQLLGATICMDGPLGLGAAALGAVAIIVGLLTLAGRFSFPGGL